MDLTLSLSDDEYQELVTAATEARLEPDKYAGRVLRASMRARHQDRTGWVRMRTIFGESVMPPGSARVVLKAVRLAVALGDVPRSARWQFVEFAAADYLAGVQAEVEDRRR